MDLWDVFVDVSWMGILIVIGQLLRAKIPLFQTFFIPAGLLAGILAFIFGPGILGWIPFSDSLSSYATVLVAVVFGATPIDEDDSDVEKKAKDNTRFKEMWGMTVNGMGIAIAQYAVGIFFTIYVLRLIEPALHEGFGLMLATCFWGGPGTAAAVGEALVDAGWNDGQSVGYTMCSIGIIGGILLGIVIINWGARHGYTNFVTSPKELPQEMKTGLIPPEKQKPSMKLTISGISVDSMAFHLGIVLLAGYLGYCLTELVQNTWNFEIPVFVTALIMGYVLQFILKKTHAARYIDKGTISRISGTATDYLIVSAIGSISVEVVLDYAVPLFATCAVAFLFNWIWFIFVGGHTSPRNWFERNMIVWGQACGVLATGILLERIVDPDQKAYALEDTGFANLIMRAPIIFLTAFPPIMINMWPETGSIVLGWGCVLATVIILIVGWKMGVYTPRGPLPKGEMYHITKGKKD